MIQTTHLDQGDVRLEPGAKLRYHFTEQLLVRQLLPRLHDAHDGSLDHHLTVLLNVLVRRFLLLANFDLERSVDVHAELLAAEMRANQQTLSESVVSFAGGKIHGLYPLIT
jgi:hypothetical protein